MSASQSTKRPCNQTLDSTAGKSERRLAKIKGVTWGIQWISHGSRRSRRLGRESCNHRLEQLMVHLSSGPLRESGNPMGAVPVMSAHPSKCELGVV